MTRQAAGFGDAISLGVMRSATTALVAVHLGITLWHGAAHRSLDVTLPTWKQAFVYIVILVAPVIAAALLWTRHAVSGAWLFFLSMLGSFLFGAYHHYVLVSPDNIHHLPAGGAGAQSSFVASAAALAIIELAAAMYGAFCLGALRAAREKAEGA